MQRLIVERYLPAAILEAASGRGRRCGVQSLMEEGGPIVGGDRVQRRDQFVEGVGLHFRPVISSAMKGVAEIVYGLLAMGLAMDDRRYLQPQQVTLVVVVGAAAPVQPAAREAGYGLSGSRIQQGTPRAPRPAWTERGRDARHLVVVILR